MGCKAARTVEDCDAEASFGPCEVSILHGTTVAQPRVPTCVTNQRASCLPDPFCSPTPTLMLGSEVQCASLLLLSRACLLPGL